VFFLPIFAAAGHFLVGCELRVAPTGPILSRGDEPMVVDADTGRTGSAPSHETAAPTAEKSKLFLRLFLQNERRLYAYILTLVPNRADADDVLQDASLVMWDKFDQHTPPNDFAAWGCRIAYFKVLDFYKRSHRSRVRFSQAMLERVAETLAEQGGALQLDDRREALTDCVQKLGPRDRELLVHRFADGATTRSTSEQTGRSVEAVYKALSKLRQILFDCVQRTLAREGRP
jgi:RNA polymerase sigma-70 factor (ECF subfamily)